MQDLPHLYTVSAHGAGDSNIIVRSDDLPDIETAGPPQFGGPGDLWSPETLLVAAVANCFILSFRAIARTARLEWTTLDCEAEGILDKVDKFNQFTSFKVTARLAIPHEDDRKKAGVILEKAEKYCLITNSMKAGAQLEASVSVAAASAA